MSLGPCSWVHFGGYTRKEQTSHWNTRVAYCSSRNPAVSPEHLTPEHWVEEKRRAALHLFPKQIRLKEWTNHQVKCFNHLDLQPKTQSFSFSNILSWNKFSNKTQRFSTNSTIRICFPLSFFFFFLDKHQIKCRWRWNTTGSWHRNYTNPRESKSVWVLLLFKS